MTCLFCKYGPVVSKAESRICFNIELCQATSVQCVCFQSRFLYVQKIKMMTVKIFKSEFKNQAKNQNHHWVTTWCFYLSFKKIISLFGVFSLIFFFLLSFHFHLLLLNSQICLVPTFLHIKLPAASNHDL